MKNITELSEQEILILTEGKLENMVKLQMAENGIKILSLPVEPNYEPLPPKTETCYSVQGFTYQFSNKEDADQLSEAIIKLAQKAITYDYNYPQSDLKWVKPLEDYSKDSLGSVKQDQFYKKSDAESIRQVKDRNDNLKKEYEADLAEYNSSIEQSATIRESIFDRYYAVQKKYYDMNTMKERFAEYVSLAQGDKIVAMKFLKNAYSINEETEIFVTGIAKPEVEKPVKKVATQKVAIEKDSDDLPIF